MLRSKSVNYVSTSIYTLIISRGGVVFATLYPCIHFMIKLHLELFLGKGWSSPLRIQVSTLFRKAPLKWLGILQFLQSEFSNIDESGNIYESRKISSSVSLVLACVTVFEVVDCVVVKVGCTWPFFANIK